MPFVGFPLNQHKSGSLFTLSFLKALHQEVTSSSPNWQQLMDSGAGKKLYLRGKYQHKPFFELKVAKLERTRSRRPPRQSPRQPPPDRPSNPVRGEIGGMLGEGGW
jgi:hypothetical protein